MDHDGRSHPVASRLTDPFISTAEGESWANHLYMELLFNARNSQLHQEYAAFLQAAGGAFTESEKLAKA